MISFTCNFLFLHGRWAIVGESELLMSDRIEQDKYLLVAAELQNHVSRLNHKSQDEQPLDCLRITFEKEYPFVMKLPSLL